MVAVVVVVVVSHIIIIIIIPITLLAQSSSGLSFLRHLSPGGWGMAESEREHSARGPGHSSGGGEKAPARLWTPEQRPA